MFQAIVLPFFDVFGQHTVVHDSCSRFRHRAVAELLERNEIARIAVPSTIGPQPMAAIWGLAEERLQRQQPETMEASKEELFFGQNCHNFVLICTLLTLLVHRKDIIILLHVHYLWLVGVKKFA